ncbi:putative signal transduction protein [Hartmannibacter diazotrophicus]|uniref:Putative signal transduction protein n=1 Tax=Hartmannibacter diazotrophicus TaxID=1482074 RepID=A0A2C9D351_9HYPH|nr:EAL domain-containing protein [Hartmannibacter diazotrophicus]SON54619.1 putative signal transduction protein [Hartmannibacter diazotrophicus]
MMRLASVLVIGSMVIIAASIVIVLNVLFDFPMGQAAILGIASLCAMVLFQTTLQRRADRDWLEKRVGEIGVVTSDLTKDVGDLTARMTRLETKVAEGLADTESPLAEEVMLLGSLLKQVTDTLADAEQRLDTLERRPQAPAHAAPVERPEPLFAEVAQPAVQQPAETFPVRHSGFHSEPPAPAPSRPAPAPAAETRVPSAVEQEIIESIRSERMEIHLQPIVVLPQRKVRIYEAIAVLRTRSGDMISGRALREMAEVARITPRIDTFLVVRAFQIMKRLNSRNRDVGIMTTLSLGSLLDGPFFREFQGFVAQNRTMAEFVTFEFAEPDVRQMGPIETESLAAIAELGYRFSIGSIADLRLDYQSLGERGFRYARVSADRLLGRGEREPLKGDIHPVDLAGHLARKGLELIVDQIETEAQVLDLLDYEIRLAQGNLFSAPRLVRPEVLQTGQPADAARATARVGR